MLSNSTQSEAALLAARFINHTNRHVFLTGKAGTGKTTFLKYIIEHTHKKAVIAAPTGIAAINAGGVTLHSLFVLPFNSYVPVRGKAELYGSMKFSTPDSLYKESLPKIAGQKRKLIQELELLIIDEVSMLRADLLDAIDAILRSIRRNAAPFGGLQVLFIGDLLQLPPVVRDGEWEVLGQYYQSPYFFDALVLKQNAPVYIELDKIYRQSDNTFINILNNLRHNVLTEEDAELLNRHYKPGFKAASDENYIYLTTHNSKAERLNREALQKLNGPSRFFQAEITGDFPEHSYPIDQTLELRLGAQVMFIKNDPTGERRFFNGKIGKVSRLSQEMIEVTFEDGDKVFVEPYEWESFKYSLKESTQEVEAEVVGVFKQYPVKLAWAITVHKSQGLTFNKAIIDLSGVFAPGQAYVALSRLTSLDGLVLSGTIKYGLEGDEAVARYTQTKDIQPALDEALNMDSQRYIQSLVLQCFGYFSILGQRLKDHLNTYHENEEGRAVRKKYVEWAHALLSDFDPVKDAAQKFIEQLKRIMQAESYQSGTLLSRIGSAKSYFVPLLKASSEKIISQMALIKEEKRVKEYVEELKELESEFYRQVLNIVKVEGLLKSAVEGSELLKENLLPESREARLERIKEAELTETAKRREKRKTEGTAGKKDTKAESLKLYKEGLSIAEIAEKRSMVPGTIEGHLAFYVGKGELDLERLLPKEKREKILAIAQSMEVPSFSAIKQALGDDYSYGEIRLAMATQEKTENN